MAYYSTTLGEDTVEDAPTIRLVNSIIERAISERASDIHLEWLSNGLTTMCGRARE